jgi:hypothetical protein
MSRLRLSVSVSSPGPAPCPDDCLSPCPLDNRSNLFAFNRSAAFRLTLRSIHSPSLVKTILGTSIERISGASQGRKKEFGLSPVSDDFGGG